MDVNLSKIMIGSDKVNKILREDHRWFNWTLNPKCTLTTSIKIGTGIELVLSLSLRQEKRVINCRFNEETSLNHIV